MNIKFTGPYKKWLASPLLIAPLLLLTACNDGDDGENGQDGGVAIHINAAKSLQAQIESVKIDTELAVAVDFYLSDANGVAVVGLTDLANIPTLGLGIAKLAEPQARKRPLSHGAQPEDAEVSPSAAIELAPQWISYINKRVLPGVVADNSLAPGWDTHKGEQWQAGIESSCGKPCLQSLGQGRYRYTFAKGLDKYSDIAEINTSYAPELVHRVYLELQPFTGKNQQATLVNTSFDFDPATGGAIDSKDGRQLIVAQQSCYRCHTSEVNQSSRLIMHGSKRFDYDGCVMCHTSYSGDPETGASLGMASLVHKIHRSDYVVIGYKGSVHDYSKVTYPGDMAQCQQCHIEGEAAQANWYQLPGQETCLSCHEASAPEDWNGTAVGLFHQRDLFPEAWALSCSGCHPDSNNPQGSALFHNKQANAAANLQDKYQFALKSSVLDVNADTLTVNLAFAGLGLSPLQDPAIESLWLTAVGNAAQEVMPINNGQRKLWNVLADNPNIEVTHQAGLMTVVINQVASADFALTKSGSLYAMARVCADKQTGLAAACTDTSISQEVSANSIALTAGVTSYAAVVSQEKCVACHDDNFQQRVVDAHYLVKEPDSRCGVCHGPQVATHFADGSCQSCHTKDMVAYMNANVKHTPGIASIKSFRSLNNSLNYREMIHSLHATTRSATGPKGEARTKITYTANANDCSACHDKGQLTMPTLSKQVSVIVAAPKASAAGQVAEYSPTVAVCASCHLVLDKWLDHAISFGGVYQSDASSGAIYQAGSESCATCHSEGKSQGLDKVHQY